MAGAALTVQNALHSGKYQLCRAFVLRSKALFLPEQRQVCPLLLQRSPPCFGIGQITLGIGMKGWGMVHMHHMGKLVHDHVIDQGRMAMHQSHIQAQGTVALHAAPAMRSFCVK